MSTATDNLRQAILDIIGKKYKKCYIGYLSVIPLSAGGWDVSLGFNTYDKPIHIAAQLEDDKFLDYFSKELSNCHFNDIHFYNGYLTDYYEPHFGIPINHTCHPHPDQLDLYTPVLNHLITSDYLCIATSDDIDVNTNNG